jgi:hypothetical protein
MSNITNTLRELNVADDAYVTLSYTEGADVWHINESHVEDAAGETGTASILARLLASGVTVSDTYSTDGDILDEMRSNGLLDDYERGEEYFQEYLTEKLQETIYDGEYSLEYSTEQYDYKRGRCDISTSVRVKVADLFRIDENKSLFTSADNIVSGFDVSVQTPAGTLTLN